MFILPCHSGKAVVPNWGSGFNIFVFFVIFLLFFESVASRAAPASILSVQTPNNLHYFSCYCCFTARPPSMLITPQPVLTLLPSLPSLLSLSCHHFFWMRGWWQVGHNPQQAGEGQQQEKQPPPCPMPMGPFLCHTSPSPPASAPVPASSPWTPRAAAPLSLPICLVRV